MRRAFTLPKAFSPARASCGVVLAGAKPSSFSFSFSESESSSVVHPSTTSPCSMNRTSAHPSVCSSRTNARRPAG